MPDSPLERFRRAVEATLCGHPIVLANPYTAWFSNGSLTLPELRHFTIQFSVFSHQFLEAQLRKCINAASLETYRAGKEILLNELGVAFGAGGSVDGSRFRFGAAHFEWLLAFARHLGLCFEQIGKRAHGTRATLHFCDTLREVYGSEDPSRAAGASYAIEHWAAAGFWKQLIAGLKIFRARELPALPLGFWVWHDRVEDQHAQHTSDELALVFDAKGFSERSFIESGSAVLDAVQTFWLGLDEDRGRRRIA
jgi:hypothetical protein